MRTSPPSQKQIAAAATIATQRYAAAAAVAVGATGSRKQNFEGADMRSEGGQGTAGQTDEAAEGGGRGSRSGMHDGSW
jgi:hypothetical protein